MKTPCGILLFSLVLPIIFSSPVHAGKEVGEVLKVKNKVYMVRNMQLSDARPRMGLFQRDAVETDRLARTKLAFRDDSILNLGELSRVEVDTYLSDSEKNRSKSIYRLVEGFLHVTVGRSDLEIHTPTALAAARGTEFILWIAGQGDSRYTGIMMMEGEAMMRNALEDVEGELTVQEGQMTRVFQNRPPEPLQPIDLDLMQQLLGKIGTVNTSVVTMEGTEVQGLVINRSRVEQSTNVAAGKESSANLGSITMKDSRVSGKIVNDSEIQRSSNAAVGDGSQANMGSIVIE